MSEVKLILGDCLEVMRTMDAVITDPPYGINFDRATWEDKPDEYCGLMKSVIAECNRLTDGPKAFYQALPSMRIWNEWFDFDYRMVAICKGFVQYRPTPLQWSYDPVIIWGNINKEPSVYHKDYYMQSKAPFGAHRKKIAHPTAKPIESLRYLVDLLSNPGNTVFDPFMGSGTTGVACVQTGRNFIGIEIDPGYFAIAKRRIEIAQMQPNLFEAAR
jgi:site-specific DNA-methyltransferase (adenine-specific)